MVVRLFRDDRLQIAYRYDCKEYADTLVRLVRANPVTLGVEASKLRFGVTDVLRTTVSSNLMLQ